LLLGATANLGYTKIVDENTFLSLSHVKVPRGDWNPSELAVVPGFKKTQLLNQNTSMMVEHSCSFMVLISIQSSGSDTIFFIVCNGISVCNCIIMLLVFEEQISHKKTNCLLILSLEEKQSCIL